MVSKDSRLFDLFSKVMFATLKLFLCLRIILSVLLACVFLSLLHHESKHVQRSYISRHPDQYTCEAPQNIHVGTLLVINCLVDLQDGKWSFQSSHYLVYIHPLCDQSHYLVCFHPLCDQFLS